MSSEAVVQPIFRDATTGEPVVLATVRTDGVDKLSVSADGIGPVTLDPTNLALDASVQDLVTLAGEVLPVLLGTAQKVAYTGTHAESSTVGATQVIICSTTDCHIAVGASPTATANSFFLPAKTFLRLLTETSDKISVIRDASDGNLFISPAV